MPALSRLRPAALRVLLVTLAAWVAGVSAVPAAESVRPLMRDFIGINGHTVQFKPQLYHPVASLVRDYHPVEWDLGKDTDFGTPFPFARNGVSWRQIYGDWQKGGWRTDVSLMIESLPRAQWKDLAADSRAYAERFARAFGPASTNAFVESVEVGNEPGKYNDADYRTIFEAMAKGFRAGDPKLKVVTCNLTTGKSHDYAKSVTCLAGLEALYDVLNVHSYAQLDNWPTWHRSFPEDPRLKEYLPDIRQVCEWRDANAPGKEVWLTEFGYDSSTQKPKPNGDFKDWVGVTDVQQAQWIVRSWLVFATMPIQRAYLYFFNDDDTPQLHGAAGLTRKFQPKPSFHAVAHLQRSLGDYRFARVVLDRDGEALVHEYTHATDPKHRVWVAWSPTGSGRTASVELPKLPGWIERAERMPLRADEDPVLPLAADAHTVPLTESPLYLFLRTP
ncbi:MAG TPA: hypothetical protein VMB21_04435 [Candidatus Limnocylindria bacterium]|nr:hypothetical protein [Candidatus Limnocylindria bacterium]